MSTSFPWTRISFRAAEKEQSSAIDFCLPNLMSGSVGVVAAVAGIGKTSLLMQFGAAVAAGIPVAGGAMPAPERTGKVVFLSAEDPPPILQRRAHFLIKSLVAQGYGGEVIDKLEADFDFLSLSGYVPVILGKSGMNKSSEEHVSALVNTVQRKNVQ